MILADDTLFDKDAGAAIDIDLKALYLIACVNSLKQMFIAFFRLCKISYTVENYSYTKICILTKSQLLLHN